MQDIKNRIDEYFSKLKFVEETHTYTVDGKILPSVSGLIKNYVEPFPKDAAKWSAKKRGISEQQIRAEWKATADEACERGTRVHLFGEEYPFDDSLKPACNQEIAITKFWKDVPDHIVPVMMEATMYHKIAGYAGTADIIMYDRQKDGIVIGDYKTNKDLFKNYKGKRMLGPFSHLLDNPFNKYTLQLSYYQILLEQVGIPVIDRKLVWLRKSSEYDMYTLDNVTEILREELKLVA